MEEEEQRRFLSQKIKDYAVRSNELDERLLRSLEHAKRNVKWSWFNFWVSVVNLIGAIWWIYKNFIV